MIWSVLLITAALVAGRATPHMEPSGFYARHAKPIWDRIAGASSEQLELPSPDGASQVVASYIETDDGIVQLTVSGRIGSGKVDIGAGVDSELLWAPDSKAFAVTTSDGGANGPYRTIVVGSGKRGLQISDISALVDRAFGHPVKCGWPERPNIGAIRWSEASEKLIVAAEIVAHSNCDSFGTFRAYEIDWRTLRVLRSFDQLEAKRRLGSSLGTELRNAPDECVRSPKKCWVSTNHPEIPRKK